MTVECNPDDVTVELMQAYVEGGVWATGKILFGDQFNLEWVDLGLLCAGSACFILALTLAQALIALQGHARAFVAWFTGLVVAVVVTAFSTTDLFRRIEFGFVSGCAIAAVAMGLQLAVRMRTASPESLALLVEQIEHEPLEI